MEDGMIDMPDLVFDEKVGNKRVRDDEEEIHKDRLEKRPSGILGVTGGEDHGGDEGGESGGGILDTFISNVFHTNTSTGTEGEVEVSGEVDTNASNVVEDEVKREDLGGGGDGGGGIISAFFSNIFHNNGSADDDVDQAKSDHLLNEVAEEAEYLGGRDGENGGGGGDGEVVDLNAEKPPEKKDQLVDLPSKDSTGPTSKMKPDDYAERVFFLNNN